MSRHFILALLTIALLSCRVPTEPSLGTLPLLGRTIVIDPAHGGSHTGARGPAGTLEKNVNLSVALELRNLLETCGATVVMTRTGDRDLDPEVEKDLDRRVALANAANPDLFLSLHANYCSNPEPRGFEVWVPQGDSKRSLASRRLANLVRQELAAFWGSEDRGTKDNHSLRVLKGTTSPAMLIETEFITNPSAEAQLVKESTCKRLAGVLARAVRKWCEAEST